MLWYIYIQSNMLKPSLYTICILTCILVLSWCGSSSRSWPIVIFDTPLQIQIPEWYSEVSPGIVENKQITNQVLKAYKKTNEDDKSGYQENIVITKSKFAEPLDYDQFRSVNQRLMMNQLVWYQPGILERGSFDCEGVRISSLVVDFILQWDIVQYFTQAQFVYKEAWYILSFASTDEDSRDDVQKWIWDISCGKEDTQ